MSQPDKLIIAKFIANPGQAEALFKVISACVKPSRDEEGNQHYDLYRSTEDNDIFLIHEQWKGDEAIEFHFKQPHFLRLIADSKPLLKSEPQIQSVTLS
ncbi:putative quinol monooxygenase [Tatumella citrea]|uniref:Drug:proton antiporter n=1 Tax=Tatumella citrea TaxID=53336 RepID=A0A1Y0L7L1_TATCI|nr:putative quinol monooxygenase [Tatumella citrea]ARU93755.1 drug:proton antiporter [Tatumella citrea]ARU97793.1 drug:proton antiporter [Tatumella citrea]